MPRRFELEDPLGLAALQELEGLGIVERKMIEVDRGVGMALVDELDGRRGGGQVAQAEEVHLQEAGLLDIPHFPLGGDDLLGLVFVGDLLQGDELFERPVGDHDAGGVSADVAIHALEPPGEIEKLARPRGLPRPSAARPALPSRPRRG